MTEDELRSDIADVRTGRLSRRDFLGRMTALGLSAPMASLMLAEAGIAQTARDVYAEYKPAKAGGGGPLKLLWWQAPTLLNPHFANGDKDLDGSRIFYEPLASWDQEGNLAPVLAAELPSREKGTVAPDGTFVIWKLKRGVTWHDGRPFTADDVVFTWQFAANPETAAVSVGSYRDITVEKLDDFTVKVLFRKPTPFWPDPFTGAYGMILPRHHFADYAGAKSREAPANLKPVGTGPYRFVDFRPGDMVRAERNTAYHVPNRPHFDTLELKGGGDAVSAARAVLQTGEYDYAWNLQVEDEILKRLEAGGKGRTVLMFGGNTEFVMLNATDPNKDVEGERASIRTKHPAFSDPAVRRAMQLLVDRSSVQQFIYGRTGRTTANILNGPPRFASQNTTFAFDVAQAEKLLEEAGWKKGADGVRAKGDARLKFVFQTTINGPRQKTQAIIKQAAAKAGIEIEIKAVPGTVFFSSDVANPDTNTHFYADMQMYTVSMNQPDPAAYMRYYYSTEAAQKSNKWQGRNVSRWQSPEYDALYDQAQAELDLVKRAALFIRMNDLVVRDNIVPILFRAQVAGHANSLVVQTSGWDSHFWMLSEWYRAA